jgi:hypothetical protein
MGNGVYLLDLGDVKRSLQQYVESIYGVCSGQGVKLLWLVFRACTWLLRL